MAVQQEITVRNAAFQTLDALRKNRRKRQKSGLFLVEGVRNINAAVSNGWTLQALAYPRGRTLSGWAREMLAQPGVALHYAIAPGLMAELSGKEDPSELLAVAAMKPDTAALDAIPSPALVVVFDRPSNKGNLGTMIRSCEAMGVHLLAVTGHAVDLYDPEVITASMGSFFRLPMLRLAGGEPLNRWLMECKDHTGATIIGTSAHGAVPLEQTPMGGPAILLIGNETAGLSAALLEICDTLAVIPFAPGCNATSLNVSCAASIFLYEAGRQRRCHAQVPR